MSATSKVPLTKRGMVSVEYSLFDPLGFIAPYIMKAKLLLQTVNRDANPADDGSKGLKLGTLIKNERWLIGPE